MIAQINICKAFKGNAAGIILLSYDNRSSSVPVTGSINALRSQQENGHGAFNHFLGINKPFHQTLLLVDNSSSQFGGIDASAAHFHKVNMTIFKSKLYQLLFIVDLSHSYNGIAA